MIIKLKVSPKNLQRLFEAPFLKEDSPSKDVPAIVLPGQPVALAEVSSNGDVPSESNSNTPVAAGTPNSSLMPPPTEMPKKKGVKRAAGPSLGPDGLPKPRGKPGPKKKARLEDGSIDHSQTAPRAPNGTAHKLGPKANQGAINAGLRALDRSGKPCRKWQKGSFKVKSFTGVVWELPRWKAPPKPKLETSTEGSSTGDSSKENKENSQRASEKSEKSGVDVEMASNGDLASSPAPPSGLQESSTPDPTTQPIKSTPLTTTTAAEASTSSSAADVIGKAELSAPAAVAA